MSLTVNFKELNEDFFPTFYQNVTKDLDALKKEVISVEGVRTFDNTIKPSILLDEKYATQQLFGVASRLHPNEKVRDNAREYRVKFSQFMIEFGYNMDLYKAVKDYYENKFQEEKEDKLTPEEVKYVEHNMRDYRRLGMHLSEENRKRVSDIKKKMSELSTKYSENLDEDTTSFEFTKEQLDGMPEMWFTDEKKLENGNYKVTLKYPDYIPLNKFCNVRATRENMWKAFASRGGQENLDLLNKTLKLRQEMAKLLGYKTFADYKVEVKIVKTANNALHEMNKVLAVMREPYIEERKKLEDYAKSHKTHPLNGTLEAWDTNYYSQKMKEEKFDIDESELQKYFPSQHVVRTTLEIYQQLLKLEFERIETDNTYHDSVKAYKVTDAVDGKLQGFFYLDLSPRDGKFGHAAVFPIVAGCDRYNGTRLYPTVVMGCNFPENEPMTYDNVNTFFHEFGHVMHALNARNQLEGFCSFGVEDDFVEFPSQMLECWTEEVEPLKRLSKHYKTGEQIPEEMVHKLYEYNNFNPASTYSRQLVFSLYDLKLHTQENVDALELFRETYKEVLGIEYPEEGMMPANFGHIMGGYEAGYYGYLYSRQMSVCAFMTRFKDNLFNSDVGYEYRKKVLEPGSSRDGMDMFRDFVGKDVDPKDFLKRIGLLKD